jgi:RNA polymerase sigma-70 factor (ECF subfamily)
MKDPTAIKKALLDLSPTEREVVLLHAVDGWEHSEIAKELGILEANSRQIYRRAMAKLKKRLGGHEGNGDEGDLCTH